MNAQLTADDVERVLREHPRLTFGGIHTLHRGSEHFEPDRRALRDWDLADVQLAARWIRDRCEPCRLWWSSYGLKHKMQSDQAYWGEATDAYVPNGVFIAAALLSGYAMKEYPDCPNVGFKFRPRKEKFSRSSNPMRTQLQK